MTKTTPEEMFQDAQQTATARYAGADLDALCRAWVWNQIILDRTDVDSLDAERVNSLAVRDVLKRQAARFGLGNTLREHIEQHRPELLTSKGLHESALAAVTKLYRALADRRGDVLFEKLLDQLAAAIEASDEVESKRLFGLMKGMAWWTWMNEATHAEDTWNLRLDALDAVHVVT